MAQKLVLFPQSKKNSDEKIIIKCDVKKNYLYPFKNTKIIWNAISVYKKYHSRCVNVIGSHIQRIGDKCWDCKICKNNSEKSSINQTKKPAVHQNKRKAF